MADQLSAQQESFAQNIFKGMNQTDAYIAAGYKARGASATSKAARLVINGKVSTRIKELAGEIKDDSIADAKERQQFWTTTLRDRELDMRDRLKASELLGKAHADFVERSEVSVKGPIVVDLLDLPSHASNG
jgi:phage terminase small subunit